MRVLFRADASVSTGTGHIVRCATLAEALLKRGVDIVFACRSEPGHLNDWLAGRGWTVYDLGKSDVHDTDETERLLASFPEPPDWLIVDHYGLDARWEKTLQEHVRRIFVIDDLADRPHQCDALLDQNRLDLQHARNAYAQLVPPDTRLLLGPQYALLRDAFTQARARFSSVSSRNTKPVERLLVFTGGTDPTGETRRILAALERVAPRIPNFERLTVDVVVGSGNPQRAELESLCIQKPEFHFHCQTDAMAALMASADLAITAGGVTTWEKLCLGLPGLVIAVADNQIEMSREVAAAGAQTFLGISEGLDPKSFKSAILQTTPIVTANRLDSALLHWLATDSREERQSLSEQAMALVDGQGTQRIVNFLLDGEKSVP